MHTPDRTRTDSFLLPGQQFCIGLPWERENLPKHGLPAKPPPPAASRNTLDERAEDADPCAGWEIGACRVIRRLSPGSVRSLLAVRRVSGEGTVPVVMRRIELPDVLAQEIEAHGRWAAQYQHQHLARVLGCEVADEGIFWVTELASGASLADIAAACRDSGKAVPMGLALATAYEAALALGELHAPPGFAHGLLSDRAVSVSFEGATKLLDVGLFRCIARKSTWAEVLETMGPYLAPEQMLEGHLPDPKCDVFSLATVLYECLSGQHLRRSQTFDTRARAYASGQFIPVSSLNVAVGKQLDAVLERALTQDRARRFATATDFAFALKEAAGTFMWRRSQRAQFVAGLFPARHEREQLLLAECRRAPRPTRESPLVKPVARAPAPRAAQVTSYARLAKVPARPGARLSNALAHQTTRSKKGRAPAPRSLRLPLLVGALSACLGALVAQHVPLTPAQSAPRLVVTMRAPVVRPSSPALVGPTAMSQELAPERFAVLVSRMASFDATVSTRAAARGDKAAAAKRRAKLSVAKRQKADDVPLPPWLAPAGRRR